MSIPLGKYPPDWDVIALAVKNEAGWRCIRCGHPHEPWTGHTLTVHHLDGNPGNCEWWNLAALCQRCHLCVQNRIIMGRAWMLEHSDWFKPYVAGYYAKCLGYRTDKEWVMEHLEMLLDYGRRGV